MAGSLLRGCVILALLLSGCTSFDCASVDAMDESFRVLSSEYLEYVDADASLTSEQKVRRREHVEAHEGLLQDLRESCGGPR